MPRVIAWSRIASGGGNWLFWPSVSRMIDAGAFAAPGTAVLVGFCGALGFCGCVSTADGRSVSPPAPMSSTIASSDVRIARPMAVARWSRSRSIAAMTRSWSVVGGWTSDASLANETTPIFTFSLCFSTNAFAAAFAAVMRSGLMSDARMLIETSIARMTVPSWLGTFTTVIGRASAKSMNASESR